ncbi:MBL fold metallo-hydrolase [Mitsuaria sp. GD03876]|uniref:MBL fold metallo-hydrolase n=1 Tax=Mitsuaria sp. GD03876 TaxID=2975399 RepID=UPI00244ADC06|nr:MBL fold metallo-hydrolase [Mitsuaria sp. GD03876]MDH0867334.1 MBL fold metallo-hydrolase [Mitsuaria sp. GD03876]
MTAKNSRFSLTPTLLTLTVAVAAAFAGPVAPALAQDNAPKLSRIQAGYQHFKIGDVEVIALSDGTLPIPAEQVLTGAKPGQVASSLARAFQTPQVEASINAFLVKAGNRLVMIDAGTGELYGPKLDKLSASLKAAGTSPEQITDILVTHIHTDHTGGLMDGSRMVFPNATLHLEQKEVDFWLSAEQRAKAPEGLKVYFDQAVAKVKPYVDAGKVKTFHGETALFPGIRSWPTPGHTPGHTSYVLESKGEKLVFLGDLVHVADVQLPHPEVTVVFDVDPKAAMAMRKRVFADALKGGYWVAGDHVTFPGVGHLQADGKGYRWIPMPYVNDFYVAK